MDTPFLTMFDTLADLRAVDPSVTMRALLVGKSSVGDGMGGFYRWDAASTAAEDATFMNVLASSVTAAGRWVRVFQRARTYPGGTMVLCGGVKTYYAQVTTGSGGDAAVTLTDDGKAAGTPLFAAVWFHDARVNAAATTPGDASNTYFKSLSADLRTLAYGTYRANVVTVTPGILYTPLAVGIAGVTVLVKVEGV